MSKAELKLPCWVLQYSPEPGDRGYLIGCCATPQNASSGEMVKRISSKKPIEMPLGIVHCLLPIINFALLAVHQRNLIC